MVEVLAVADKYRNIIKAELVAVAKDKHLHPHLKICETTVLQEHPPH